MDSQTRYEKMINTPVKRLIPKIAIPTIISMLVTSIYNISDTYFVSGLGMAQSGAVSVIFSLMALLQAFGFTIGMGSGSFVSRLLGEKQTQTARNVVSTAFFTAIVFGICFGGICLLNITPLVSFLGANDDILPHAVSYCRFILYAAPFMMASFVLNNQLRSQGRAVMSMIGIASGGILNIFLDYIFVRVLGYGTGGAGFATMISQMTSFSVLVLLSIFDSSVISPSFKTFKPSMKIYVEIIHTGMPSLCRQGLASLAAVMLNKVAQSAGVEATQTIAAMGILNKLMLFINSSLIGFGQGMQPVCGFNYGAKRYDRVLLSYRFCKKTAVIFLSCMAVILFIFATPIMTIFIKNDAKALSIATFALRALCFTLPAQGYMMMSQFLAQSIGYGLRASVVAMGRQGLCLIPMYFILPRAFGVVRGITLSQPFSDAFSFVIAFLIVRSVVKDLKLKQQQIKG